MMQGRARLMSANTKKINSTLSIPIYLDYSSTTPVVAAKASMCNVTTKPYLFRNI